MNCRHILAGIVLLAVFGCAAQVNQTMGTWIGHHQSEVIQAWGPPIETTPDGSGGTIMIYSEQVELPQTPGKAYADPWSGAVRYTNPKTNGYTRTRMFYVNSAGVVYHWRWQGY